MTEYGEMIRAFRKAAGLTQKQLGLACGFDEKNADRNVRGWEAGKSYPTIYVLRRLSAALGVPIENLVP